MKPTRWWLLSLAVLVATSSVSVEPHAQDDVGLASDMHFENYLGTVILPFSNLAGEKANLQLTTYKSITTIVLSQEKAQSLAGRPMNDRATIFGYGAREGHLGKSSRSLLLKLGSLTLTTPALFSPSPAATASQAFNGEGFDGVIGADIFSQYVVDVDFDQSRILFFHPHLMKSGPALESSVVPLKLKRGIPYVDINVVLSDGSSHPLLLAVDTGSPHLEILLDSNSLPFPRLLPAFKKARFETRRGLQTEGSLVRFEEVDIGGQAVSSVIAYIYPFGRKRHQDVHGSIGAGLLRRFNYRLDYPNRQLALVPNRQFKSPSLADCLGATFAVRRAEDMSFVINHIMLDSAAADAGIRPGDQLVKVDDTQTESIGRFRLFDLLRGEVGRTIRLELKRGESVRATQVACRPII